MEHIEFENVNIPVAVAAKALNSDCQTVRYLLQQGMVDWIAHIIPVVNKAVFDIGQKEVQNEN